MRSRSCTDIGVPAWSRRTIATVERAAWPVVDRTAQPACREAIGPASRSSERDAELRARLRDHYACLDRHTVRRTHPNAGGYGLAVDEGPGSGDVGALHIGRPSTYRDAGEAVLGRRLCTDLAVRPRACRSSARDGQGNSCNSGSPCEQDVSPLISQFGSPKTPMSSACQPVTPAIGTPPPRSASARVHLITSICRRSSAFERVYRRLRSLTPDAVTTVSGGTSLATTAPAPTTEP